MLNELTFFSYSKCPICRTTINLDKNGRITDASVPGAHLIAIVILSIALVGVLAIILVDAFSYVNTARKLEPIGVIYFVDLLGYLMAPYTAPGFSRRYSSIGILTAITFSLLYFLFLNLMHPSFR